MALRKLSTRAMCRHCSRLWLVRVFSLIFFLSCFKRLGGDPEDLLPQLRSRELRRLLCDCVRWEVR